VAPRKPKTKTVPTNARIIINQEWGSWACASLFVEFGPNFEQRICLGWVSDVTSQAESFVGIRNQSGPPEPRICHLHESLIKEARKVINDEEEVEALTRFERITRED
jgi:hypothetical protein